MNYIGVTGITSGGEALYLLRRAMLPPDRKVMIGVLASSKSIRRQANKWPNRYPAPEKISGIFIDHKDALNLVHFSTKEPEQLLEQMLEVTDLAGQNFQGFQLNVKWPSPKVIADYRRMVSGRTIVLQVGSGAFEAIGNSPANLAAKVREEYTGLADHVLLDPSGGLGKSFDTEVARVYLRALTEAGVEAGLGVAGGLSGLSLQLVEPLLDEFPNLSIDAEGRLRTVNDHLDLDLVTLYLNSAYMTFESFRRE